MKKPFSRSHQREMKRQTIISEASRLFNYRGTKATTLDDIASALKLTKTSLYYYARNKEELVHMCYVAACEAGDEIMEEAESGAQNGMECLLNFMRIFFRRWDEIESGQRPYSAMLVEISALNAQHRQDIESRVSRYFDKLLGFIQRGIGDGSVSDCEPVPTTLALLALVNWSYVWFGRIPIDQRPEVVDQLTDLVKQGISVDDYRFSDIHFPEPDPELFSGFDREQQNQMKLNAFLQMGARMFNERGYRGTSLDEVAKQLEVTKGAFYYHIKNKEDMLFQCFQRMLELEAETIQAACRAGGNGAEKIELVLRHLFNIQHSQEGPLIGYRSLLSLTEQHRREILDRTQELSDQLGLLISEGIEDGSIRNVNPQIIEHVIAGAIDAAPDLANRMQVVDNVTSSADYLRLIFNGIARRPNESSTA